MTAIHSNRRRFLAMAALFAATVSAAPIADITIPHGYRDWRLISVAREERADEKVHSTCYSCHQAADARDFVFTNYSR